MFVFSEIVDHFLATYVFTDRSNDIKEGETTVGKILRDLMDNVDELQDYCNEFNGCSCAKISCEDIQLIQQNIRKKRNTNAHPIISGLDLETANEFFEFLPKQSKKSVRKILDALTEKGYFDQ